MTEEAVVEMKNLSKAYREKIIFDGFNLKIPQGKMTAIYGPSGAGKSTLLNMIGMIEDYDDGELSLFGEPAPEVNSRQSLILRRYNISYLFQNFALVEDESIEKNLTIALLYKKLSTLQKQEKMLEMLHKVHLVHDLKTKIFSLSGGEKQRIAVARALLKESPLILADEPTGSLDEKNRDEILKLLRQEVADGKTIAIVTHDLDIVSQSDVVLRL